MQSTSKLCVASASAQPAVRRFDCWADLTDGPLSSILALSGSFRDVLPFAATCRSWRAAFSSYPSKSTFCTKFPPLLVQFNARVQAPDLPSNNGRQKLRTCKVIDPINKNIALRCQIPREIYQKMQFAGTSYGQLICCHAGYCLVVDVFSGAKVSPPRLPFTGDCEKEFYFYVSGTLTAPLASPNSHLLVSTATALFDWSVGSDSWSVLQLSDAPIEKIVEFNGQFIAMDDFYKIYTLQLSPQLGLQEITTEWVGDLAPSSDAKPWLVVCGNMLLMVYCFSTTSLGCSVVQCIPHHLDMSTSPAKWVEVRQLDNWELFVGGDVRSRLFSCRSPERWGGRSKWLYYAGRRSFIVHGVGDERDPSAGPNVEYKRSSSGRLQPLWVYPSMFYSGVQ
ncbi:hypothetical protein CFC21_055369 [Triticum aestivum]|uniref:KIB1-4 beta-propeller domain-containing protein n=2 Tax=Triticum aestivum TaxID=4565 RepID=A0A9R1GGQ9_WHEAT|nr:uncharacterized protein LOC123088380 [Triticum aestivum]KAF7046337.1 hypothetical protein CFC21_055369 [Triticum aestivum]